MFRRAWERFCRSKKLYEYAFSSQVGFHVTEDHVALGKKIRWGKPEERRSSALRNSSSGKVWQYGVSASFNSWPFPHFKLKPRVLFSELDGMKAGEVINDSEKQHKLRRSVCKGWRNKAWHGRLMALMELLSDKTQFIELSLAEGFSIRLDSSPMQVTCPVTTILPDTMPEDAEEDDSSTLGNFNLVEEE